MKKLFRFWIMAMATAMLALFSPAGAQVPGQGQLQGKIRALETMYPGLCSVRSLAKTAGGFDIWLITIGTGEKDNKPGIVVAGGVDGRYIFSRELAYGFAERILRESNENEIKDLLGKITFYILPDLSPDASSQYYSNIKYERNVNSRSTDDDRDFDVNEDPCDDLNKDGFITLIRVKDPSGNFIESSDDRRLMVKADIAKGQTGDYLVYSEGVDNDKDGSFNEDGEGGVAFNRNFTFNYEEFGRNSGQYPVSEPEVKAVADFLFDRFNVYAVFTFGPQDNLGQPMKAPDRPENARGSASDPAQYLQGDPGMMRRERGKITSIMKTDETINKLVSERYHEITGLKGAPASVTEPGNFMEWAYFHYGRYSFSTPGWWLTSEKGKNAEAEFLKFAEKKNMTDVFVPWTKIDHPDFPGKTVEAGGIKPFVMINPPQDTTATLIDSHYRFLKTIAAMHPELEFLDIKTENAGENIYRIILKVHNKGIFATCTEAGDQNIWTRIMRISIEPGTGQTILSGQKVQRIQRLQGDESAEFSWLVSGKGKVNIKAGAANTGTINTSIVLK